MREPAGTLLIFLYASSFVFRRIYLRVERQASLTRTAIHFTTLFRVFTFR